MSGPLDRAGAMVPPSSCCGRTWAGLARKHRARPRPHRPSGVFTVKIRLSEVRRGKCLVGGEVVRLFCLHTSYRMPNERREVAPTSAPPRTQQHPDHVTPGALQRFWGVHLAGSPKPYSQHTPSRSKSQSPLLQRPCSMSQRPDAKHVQNHETPHRVNSSVGRPSIQERPSNPERSNSVQHPQKQAQQPSTSTPTPQKRRKHFIQDQQILVLMGCWVFSLNW